uniref:Uncharacterized protein n=1 Tax=Ditylenchus dipsaci TaxID=166011 RepID=A0A915DS44_9BILA
MAFYRITYVLTYVDIGSTYSLEPPIDMVTCFPVTSSIPSDQRPAALTPKKTVKKTLLANNTKKFIAHQIELAILEVELQEWMSTD